MSTSSLAWSRIHVDVQHTGWSGSYFGLKVKRWSPFTEAQPFLANCQRYEAGDSRGTNVSTH